MCLVTVKSLSYLSNYFGLLLIVSKRHCIPNYFFFKVVILTNILFLIFYFQRRKNNIIQSFLMLKFLINKIS